MNLDELARALSDCGVTIKSGIFCLGGESEVKELSREDRAVTVTISTRARDRHGDVMVPEGVRLERFRRNPVVLYAHDHDGLPVAKSISEKLDSGRLVARPQFHLQTELSREVWALIEKGVLNAWSVGFMPEKWEPARDGGGFVIEKWDLLEYSAVPVPANFEALTRELKEKRISAPHLVRSLEPLGLAAPDLYDAGTKAGHGAAAEEGKDEMDWSKIDKAALAKERPDLVEAIGRDAAEASRKEAEDLKTASAKALEEAVKAERDRILAIDALPGSRGHEELLAKLKADGRTTKAEAALAILESEKASRDKSLSARKSDASELDAVTNGAAGGEQDDRGEIEAEAKAMAEAANSLAGRKS